MFVICSVNVKAQYIPFVNNSYSSWGYLNVILPPETDYDALPYETNVEEFSINGKKYHQLNIVFAIPELDFNNNSNDDWWNAILYIRDKEGQLLADAESFTQYQKLKWYSGPKDFCPFEKTADGEVILYDFTKEKGDVYRSIEGHEDITVADVGTMTTKDGLSRKTMTLSNGAVIVEGMGCVLKGTLLNYLDSNPLCFLTYFDYDNKNAYGINREDTYEKIFHRPMLKEGKVWNYVYHHYDAFPMEQEEGKDENSVYYVETESPVRYVLEDMVAIDGHECYRMYQSVDGGQPTYHSSWYEEDRKVYRIDEQTKEETLMFDFSVDKGDVITYDIVLVGQGEAEVMGFDVVEYNGEYLAACNLSDGSTDYKWIDGVGGEREGILNNWAQMILPGFEDYTTFASCEEDGKVIWGTTPETGVKSIEKTASLKSNVLYDLSGRRLIREPQRGVYIRDGKKVVIK